MIAKGADSETKDEKQSSIQVEAQGNAIDAMGWTSPNNTNDVVMNIKKITNNGVAVGEADLQGGLGSVHGRTETFGSANGISILGATDWGSNSTDGTSGATGSSGASAVATGTTTRTPTELRGTGSRGTSGYDSDAQISSDLNGKSVKVELGENTVTGVSQNVIENTGLLRGELKAVSNQDITNPITEEDAPQFFGAKSGASGNGISVASLVSSVNSQTDSSEKYNYAMIYGLIDNKGTVEGLATLLGGKNTTWTQTSSVATGNGISVFAQTRNPANSKTAAFMSGLSNSGKVIGKLQQISGDNSVNKESMTYSAATSFSSGNGVSVHTDTYNATTGMKQTPVTRIGNIANSGKISGEAYVKAGDGIGNMGVEVRGDGNGISANNYGGGRAAIGNVNNNGMIVGKVETHAGIGVGAAGSGKTIPLEEAKVSIYYDANREASNQFNHWNALPKQVSDSATLSAYQSIQSSLNYSADSWVIASGNGISGYQGNRVGATAAETASDGAILGNVNNDGVISGYAKMYHGIIPNNDNVYQRVNFLSVGTGISTDRALTSDINNTGIVSGNHAAMLFKGVYDDSRSSGAAAYQTGYYGKVNNYGLMAGTMIAGNYRTLPTANSYGQYQPYYVTATDPVTNSGTYVYLKEGTTNQCTSSCSSYYSTTVFNDDYETIDRVVKAEDSTQEINGVSYEIINGTLSSDKKDSSYTASGALSNKIINGVGATGGALITNGDTTLNNSNVNGYVNALNIANGNTVNLQGSTLNANGFDVRTKLSDGTYTYVKPLAVKGSTGAETLNVSGNSIINGNIDMGAGDDTLNIKSSSAHFNGDTVDLGAGNDKVNLSSGTETAPVTVDYTLKNAETVSVDGVAKLSYDAKITGTKDLVLNAGSKLIYQVADVQTETDKQNGKQATKHALYDTDVKDALKISGKGEIVFDTAKAVDVIDFGRNIGFDNNVIKTNSSDVLQTVEVKDGVVVIGVKKSDDNTGGTGSNTGGTGSNTGGTGSNTGGTGSNTGGTGGNTGSNTGSNTNTFKTPYVDAYNSLTSAMTSTNSKILLGSSSTLDKTEAQAIAAVNDYLNKTVENNLYGAIPKLAHQNAINNIGTTLELNGKLLKQGETDVQLKAAKNTLKFDNTADEAETDSVLIKAEYGVTDNLTIGASIAKANTDLTGLQGSYLDGDSTFASLFATKGIGDKATLTVGIAKDTTDLEGKRNISNGYDAHSFDTKTDLSTVSLFTQGKYNIALTDALTYTPKVGLAYSTTTIDGINETGTAALQVAESKQKTVDVMIGQDLTYQQPMATGNLTAKLSLDYIKTSGQDDLTARFVGGTDFAIKAEESDQAVKVGAAVGFDMPNGFSAEAGFANSFIGSGNDVGGFVKLGYKF